MRHLWRYHRSLTLQLSLVSVVFTLLALFQFLISPVLENPAWKTRESTATLLHQELQEAALANPENIQTVKSVEFVNKIVEANPSFRLYAETKHSRVEIGGSLHPDRRKDILSVLDRNSAPAKIERDDFGHVYCSDASYMTAIITEGGNFGRVEATNCPVGVTYFEVVGIENPIQPNSSIASSFVFWNLRRLSSEYIIIASGVLIIGLYTLFQSARSVRKIARVTQKLELSRNGQRLDRTGLPLEITPIVDALNDLLHRLDQFRDQQSFFLATAAHELRTPLTVLRTRIERVSNEEVRGALSNDVSRISRLVEQLLQLTNVSGQVSLVMEQIDLHQLVLEVCASRAPIAVKSQIELELAPTSSRPEIRGDSVIISTAISNLIDNAISVSEANQRVVVRISADARVQVRDFGPGIEASQHAKVFEPFAKFPPNRNGHGLGLAIVSAIMSIFGGKARILTPDDGQSGTIFELSFSHASLKSK